MRWLGGLIAAAGFLLLIIVASPLVAFYEHMDGINMSTTITGDKIIISIDYNIPVKFTDYSLSIYSNGTLLNRTSGEALVNGSTISVTIPASQAQNLTISFEGKIAGLYYIKITVHPTG